MMASGPNVRRVLITGAARGIGKAIADCYAAHRYDVIAPTRGELDLSSLDAVQAFVDLGMPEIDVLINNAADSKTGPIERLRLADWQQVLTVNLTAPLLLLQAAARGMCARKWGRIVNVSSCYSIGPLLREVFEAMTGNYGHSAQGIAPERKWSRVVFSGGLACRVAPLREAILGRIGTAHRVAARKEDALCCLLTLARAFDGRGPVLEAARDLQIQPES